MRPATAEVRRAGARVPRAAIAVLAGLVLLAVMLRLGFWQLERAGYKDALAQRFAENAEAPARSPEAWLASGPADRWRFAPVRASGTPLASRQFLLDNRTHRRQAGYHVLTVLERPQGSVLVNRGWVPVGEDRGRLPDVALPAGPLQVQGLLVPAPESGLLLGASGYESDSWPRVVQTVDMQRIGEQAGAPLLPSVLLLDARHPACFVCDWSPVVGVSADRHRGYAVQWFALSVALVALAAVVGVRARRARRDG